MRYFLYVKQEKTLQNLQESYQRNGEIYWNKVLIFKSNMPLLFDVATCKYAEFKISSQCVKAQKSSISGTDQRSDRKIDN